jgi:hypothetical protein
MSSFDEMRARVAVPVLDDHPSSYVVRDFVESLVREGVKPIRLPRWIGPILTRSIHRVPHFSRQLVIVPLMGPRFDTLAAASLYGVPIPFCWDVWEPRWHLWTKYLDRWQPPLVIATARRSVEHLRATLKSSVVEHVPEAINTSRYESGSPLSARSIDVLELGRRNARWHEIVRMAAERHGVKHLYERVPGDLIFPDEAALVTGLAESKISVCFPSNVTHPERSGSVSTVTSRYLESLASRCLVLGEVPNELSDLLGFDPSVRADMEQPWQQVQMILESIELYQGQVDAAHERVRLVGGWDFRVRQVLDLVQGLQY